MFSEWQQSIIEAHKKPPKGNADKEMVLSLRGPVDKTNSKIILELNNFAGVRLVLLFG